MSYIFETTTNWPGYDVIGPTHTTLQYGDLLKLKAMELAIEHLGTRKKDQARREALADQILEYLKK